MKQLTHESIKSMVEQMNPGESMLIPYNLEQSVDLMHGINVNIIPIDNESFKIQKPNKKGPSKFAQITRLLENYKRGEMIVPFEIAYVRQVVSKYNSKHAIGRFTIKCENDNVFVSKHIKHWNEITESEFNQYENEVIHELANLKRKIVVESEFVPLVLDDEINENQLILELDDDEIL